jgi:uncharacterized protein
MELTQVEKLILSNQYEILKGIYPNRAEEFDTILESLQSGYDGDFKELACQGFEKSLSTTTYQEVREILQMFRALKPAYGVPAAANFVGFDGNEEADYHSYAIFLLERRGLWKELHRDDYNTHCPVLPDYRKMLEEWRITGRSHHLSPEQMERIASYAPMKEDL